MCSSKHPHGVALGGNEATIPQLRRPVQTMGGTEAFDVYFGRLIYISGVLKLQNGSKIRMSGSEIAK